MDALTILSFHDVSIFYCFGVTWGQCDNMGLDLIISNDLLLIGLNTLKPILS